MEQKAVRSEEGRVLFVFCNNRRGTSIWAKKEALLNEPKFDAFYNREFLEETLGKYKRNRLDEMLFTDGNVGGEFIAQNLETKSKVVHEPISVERLRQEVETFRPTHVGFSILLGAYQDFINCSRFLRLYYPNIKIIAGSVGAFIPETRDLSDYLCSGEGVSFMRELLGERAINSLKIPRIIMKRFRPSPLNPKKLVQLPVGILTTNLGCHMKCDFCVTCALFQKRFQIGTALDIKDALLDVGSMIDLDNVTIILTDPIGLVNEKRWSEVIRLMRGESRCFHFNILTTSKLLEKYSRHDGLLDQFKRSEEMEISLVELGIETTIATKYRKNYNVNWKNLLQNLHDHGIITGLSIIVGWDHHDRRNALHEIENVIALDTAILHVVNLRVLPGTSLWHVFEKNQRLMDVPPEFRMLWGYQAFSHPHFEPRFKDCLPLMLEIKEMINGSFGNYYANALKIIKKRRSSTYNDNLIQIGEALMQRAER